MDSLRKIVSQGKRRAKAALGRDVFLTADLDARVSVYGNPGAQWAVVADQITPDAVIYSAGIGKDISFDLLLIERHGVRVHGFDPTPASLEWLATQTVPPQFEVHPWGFADFDGTATFWAPEDPNHVSHTTLEGTGRTRAIEVQMKRLETTMTELGHARLDLLKIDIEGAEYGFLAELVAGSVRPRQLLVEFHHRFAGVGAGKTLAAVESLKGAGYGLAHVSETHEEVTFLLRS